jgi:hypothetical protein
VARAALFVDMLQATVPVYPLCGVSVMVEVPELPWATDRFVAESVNVPLPEPLEPPTFKTIDPVDPAYVESPE